LITIAQFISPQQQHKKPDRPPVKSLLVTTNRARDSITKPAVAIPAAGTTRGKVAIQNKLPDKVLKTGECCSIECCSGWVCCSDKICRQQWHCVLAKHSEVFWLVKFQHIFHKPMFYRGADKSLAW